MKRLLMVGLVLAYLFAGSAFAADYYVANNGNDDDSATTGNPNNGRFPESPWLTIHKVNNFPFLPGDTIHFKCGDEWHEELYVSYSGINGSPIRFMGGTDNEPCTADNKPILNGARRASGWEATAANPNIYFISGITEEVKQLFLGANRERQVLARYPNNGYLTIPVNSAVDQVIGYSDDLTQDDDYWNNADIYIRYAPYAIAKRNVVDYMKNSSLIQLDMGLPDWTKLQGYGYYFENKFEELDSSGEWFYDRDAGTLYFWPPDGVFLTGDNSTDVEMSVLGSGIRIQNDAMYSAIHHVRIENLDIRNYTGYGIVSTDFWTASEVEIINNDISGIGDAGIRLFSAPDNVLISGNKITDIQNDGIILSQSEHCTISDNEISNVRNIGINIEWGGRHANIKDNSISQTGYTGISVLGKYTDRLWAYSNTVSGNIIKNTCLILDDSAIYTQYTDGTTITGNIVENVIGNVEGKAWKATEAFGLHLDHNSQHATVSGNTFINADYGILLENANDNFIHHNLIYSARRAGLALSQWVKYPDTNVNNTIENNTFYTEDTAEACVLMMSSDLDHAFGVFDNNYYAQPFNHYAFSRNRINPDWSVAEKELLYLSEWKNISGLDANSESLENVFGFNKLYPSLFVNYNRAPGDFILNGEYLNLYGSNPGSPITLGALSAQILVHDYSLVAHWKLDESGAISMVHDSTVNMNNGTISGNIDWSQGEIGGALSFNGSSNKVTIPDSSSLEINGDLTISGWIYPDNIAKGRQSIIYKSYAYEYDVIMEPDGRISFYHGDGNWEEIYEPAGMVVAQDQWSHIAITRRMSDKTMSFYLNGALIGTVGFNKIPAASSNPVIIGHRTGSGYYFSGKMDDMRIYNFALSASEIREINKRKLAAYWKLDEEGDGLTAIDATANQNNGTISGGINWSQGEIGGALSFNGSSNKVTIPDSSSLELNGDLTISGWIFPDNIAKGRQSIIYKHYNNEYEVMMEPNGKISFYHGDGSWEEKSLAGMVVVQNQWNHIAITRRMSDKTISFYSNGELIGTVGFNKIPAVSSNPVILGHRTGYDYYFSGKMDDIRIYGYPMMEYEVQNIYRQIEFVEICDGIDNDGDGLTDEGVINYYYRDADGDGYGDPAVSVQNCAAPAGYAADGADCNDNDPAVNSGSVEILCNGKDDDCNPGTLNNGASGGYCDYYVDAANGDDGNSGASEQAPWKTIPKVNDTGFIPGDRVRFRCRQTWREQLNVPSPDITITSYPENCPDKPVIDAAKEVNHWRLCTSDVNDADYCSGLSGYGNIYYADVNDLPGAIKQVFVNGEFMKLAEYRAGTNGGYFVIDEDSGNISLKDSELIIPNNQTIVGAGIHIRTVNWRIEDRTVSGYDLNVLSWDTATEFSIKKDYGYYLDNKLWMLDSAGEWHYDGTNSRLYVWLPDNSDPNTHIIEASVYDFGISINGKNNVVIDGLQIKYASINGISAVNSSTLTISNAEISDSGRNGIYLSYSPSGLIQSCIVKRSVNQGIYLHWSDDADVLDNLIEDTGIIGSPKNSIAAITTHEAANAEIIGNNILNSGYLGIALKQGSKAINNIIEEACLVLNDCSGIYTASGSSITSATQIIGNIITDSIGNIDGTPPYNYLSAKGIYLDNNADTAVVENNTVVNASNGGIALHGARNMSVADNTLYGNRNSQIVLYTWTTDDMGNNTIADNIFFPLSSDDHVIVQGDYGNIDLGDFDRNTYSIIHSDYVANEKLRNGLDDFYLSTRYTMDEWKLKGMEAGAALFYPFDISSDRVHSIDSGNLVINGAFDTSNASWSGWSTNGDAVWPFLESCNVTGGCLSFTSGSSSIDNHVTSNKFSLTRGKTYMLEFKAKAFGEQSIDDMTVWIMKPEPPYWESIGLEKTVDVQTTWHNYRYVFTANQTLVDRVVVYFYLPPGRLTVFIDEVVVSEVTAATHSYSEILINKNSDKSAEDEVFECPYGDDLCRQYKCLNCEVSWYDDNITVGPYSSKIVVWTGYPYIDTDHDGILDDEDNCPEQENPFQTDIDADGAGDDCDCSDNDSTIFPGAPELCDSKDNNCNGGVDESTDADGDGYPAACGGDCDDSSSAVNPGAQEIPNNGIDDDCNVNTQDGSVIADDFNGGINSGWLPVSGDWAAEAGGYYGFSGVDTGNPLSVTVVGNSATSSSMVIEVDYYSLTSENALNGFIIFDYDDATGSFKYAGAKDGANYWTIGYYDGDWIDMATYPEDIVTERWYRMRVTINGTTVSLDVDDDRDASGYVNKVIYTFSSIGNGQIGLARMNSHAWFDNFAVYYDADGDGYIADVDCNDNDAGIYPGGPPVRVVGGISYYSTLQGAYDAAANGSTIMINAVTLREDLNFNLDKTLMLNGGYDCGYSMVTGITTISGNVTISDGEVTIENLEIQ